MPFYTTCCEACGKRADLFRKIAQRDILPTCACGGAVHRIVTAAAVQGEIVPYISPATGEYITSRAQRREEMHRAGYITLEPGLKEQIAKNKAASYQKTLDAVDPIVDSLVASLNVAGKLDAPHAN